MNTFLKNRTRLNLCITFLLVIGIAVLGGCSSGKSTSTSISQSSTETSILSTAEPPITFTPSSQAIPATTTALQIPENIVKFQPFEITFGAPRDAKPMGALAICGDLAIQLLQFTPDVKVETVPGVVDDPFCLETSPDGKWIAYEESFNESSTGSWLVVQSADGQQQKKVPEDPDWVNFGDYVWLDNQHLIFNNFINPPDIQRTQAYPAYPMVVVNPFTGEHIELSSEYPELKLGINGPVGTLAFNYTDVVYDPSLDLVIFPAWGGEHNYIVLWDRHSQAVLARVEDHSGGFGHYPLWSRDTTQFAVAVMNAIKGERGIDEWYRVSREGQVEQLTRFGDYFSSSEIESASNWSPDGKKLAFWINLDPSPCPGLRLAILDVSTKQVTNTCLPGTRKYAPPPIWSFDSRYIVIGDYSDPPIKTILVDIENGRAFDITSLIGDSRPIGWLVSP